MSPEETFHVSHHDYPVAITRTIYWNKTLALLFFRDEKKILVLYLPNLVFCVFLSLSGYLKALRREKLRNWKPCCVTSGELRRQVSTKTSFLMFHYVLFHFQAEMRLLFLFSPPSPRAQRSCYVHKTINKQFYKLGKVPLSFLLS